jgi:hypothetical protein
VIGRLFPTLSNWPPEKWLALPGIVFFGVGLVIGISGKVFGYFGIFLVRVIAMP